MSVRFPALVAALVAAVVAVLALPAPAGAQDPYPPAVAFVGDSTGAMAREEIHQEVNRSRPLRLLMAAGMATPGSALPRVAEAAGQPDAPPIWVIALGHAYANGGHSDATFEHDIRAVLDAVAPHVACVRWFEITEELTFYAGVNERAPAFNRVLRSVSAEYENVEVMHYAHWARIAPDSVWIEDGLHHSPEGEREMGRLVAQAAEGCDPATNSGPYWDVADDAREAGAITWLAEHGYASAFWNGTYRATIGSVAVPASRGAVAATVWRWAGAPAGHPPARWSDVGPPFRRPLAWIDAGRLATAYPDGTYRPEAPATRGHAALLLWQLAGRPTVSRPAPWSDVPDRLRGALDWLAAHRGRDAFPGRQFEAARILTRAELALLLAPASAAPVGGEASPVGTRYPPPDYVVLDEAPGPPLGNRRRAAP